MGWTEVEIGVMNGWDRVGQVMGCLVGASTLIGVGGWKVIGWISCDVDSSSVGVSWHTCHGCSLRVRGDSFFRVNIPKTVDA